MLVTGPEAFVLRHLGMVRTIAGRSARRHPRLADDLESAAMLGLWEAAMKYDPGRGVREETYLLHRVNGAILDALRAARPKGFRRDIEAAPNVGQMSFFDEAEGLPEFLEPAADDLPIGWELESIDAVERLCRSLPPKQSDAIRRHYSVAGATLARIGAEVGRTESCISQRVLEGLALLRVELE